MAEGTTCYERDEVFCEDQMCLRTGCRLRNARMTQNPDPLRSALEEIARQHTTDEMCEAEVDGADFENAYDIIIGRARAALASPQGRDAVIVKAPHDLQALLATMKAAQKQRVNMNIWDRDIKTIEDAIAIIEGLRSLKSSAPPVEKI